MKFIVALFVILCTVPFFAYSAGEGFARTLRVGMRGEDVRLMQQLLNRDPQTRISATGPGSPGNETDYFGVATKRAVIKFQEKYRDEILKPAGLAAGTGIFGSGTRTKAQIILGNAKTSERAVAVTTIAASDEKGDVFVMFPSRYSGVPGTAITISGAGFTTKDNTIYFGEWNAVEKAASWNGQEIAFKIPAIKKGVYSLFVKNAKGESNKDQFFVVTDGVTPEPKIENLSPSRATRGATINIAGSGFTEKGNMLRTGAGVETGVSSVDGTAMSFTIPSDFLMTSTSTPTSAKKTIFQFWVYVVNENGISNGKSIDIEL